VYNAVSPSSYVFQRSVAAGAPLVFLSRIEEIKGCHIAIEIAKRAGRRLMIAGNHIEGGEAGRYWSERILPEIGRNGKARVWRKRLGGGMRQIGILAAAGQVALEEGPRRLHEDHQNARRLAEGIAEVAGISIDPSAVQTNIVIFDVSGTGKTSSEICSRLKEDDVLAIAISDTQIRRVTHLDVSGEDIDTAVESLKRSVSGLQARLLRSSQL
jgi:hypothetical protein